MSFTVTPQRVPDVLLVEHPRFGDERGFFCETFRENALREHGIGPLVQDNHSRSSRGVLRGLHFQEPPVALGKLVRCVRGRIFDSFLHFFYDKVRCRRIRITDAEIYNGSSLINRFLL